MGLSGASTTDVPSNAKQIKMSVKVEGMDHAQLMANDAVKTDVEQVFKSEYATKADVPTNKVTITLKSGSVIAEALITVPSGTDVDTVTAALNSNSDTFLSGIVTQLNAVANIDTVTDGSLVATIHEDASELLSELDDGSVANSLTFVAAMAFVGAATLHLW